jgi:cytochrome c553
LFLALFTMAPASAAEPARSALPPAPQKSPLAAEAERALALAEGGNAGRGKVAYAVCSACHQPSGLGKRDGSIPKLAGQHATVLIKQIADIRGDVRDIPTMHSFVRELRDPRDIADVAAYIETLCIPPGNGRYSLSDVEARLAEGRQLFVRDCADCHQEGGQGDKAKGYPLLAGQHYRYLLRQMEDIRDGYRQAADPDMVKTIRKYKNDKLQSMAAYLASLETPGTTCEPVQAGK